MLHQRLELSAVHKEMHPPSMKPTCCSANNQSNRSTANVAKVILEKRSYTNNPSLCKSNCRSVQFRANDSFSTVH